jgi:hypothetical protein
MHRSDDCRSWNFIVSVNRWAHVSFWFWKKLNFFISVSKQKRTRKNCFRYLKLMSPLNVAICTTISYTLWVEWYYYIVLVCFFLPLLLLLLSEACPDHNFIVFPDRSIIFGMWVHDHKAVCRMILFKKQLFDLEVKVPRRSLWYDKHRLMVMHPHTKYHW